MSWPPQLNPSITSGRRFARAAYRAAVYPAGPPPMMITCRMSLSVIVLRLSLSPVFNESGRPWLPRGLGHKRPAEEEPAVPDLGLVIEAVTFVPVRSEQVDDRLAAGGQELGDQAPVAAPP